MSRIVCALAVACVACVGCQDDVCDDLQDRRFTSVELLPCNTPTQQMDCNWTLDFRSGRFVWQHDDVDEGGSYSCGTDDISATSDTGAVYSGGYDTDTDVLEWDGRPYRPTSP
jgi:hypothetical protein